MTGHLNREFDITIGNSDLFGRLKVSELFRFMQESAAMHAGILGVGMDEMMGKNITFVLVRVKIEINEMPAIGRTINLKTFPVGMNRHFFIRDFVISTGGVEFAKARTCWLVMDLKSRRPVKADNPAIEMAPALEGEKPPEVPQKPVSGGNETKFNEIRVGYSLIDILGHVNNTRYMEWVEDCMGTDFFKNNRSYSITLNFSCELVENDKIDIMGDNKTCLGRNEKGKECFIASFEGKV